MILGFQTAGGLLEVQIDENRTLSVRGKLTNHQFISLKKLIELSGQEGRAVDITLRILSCRHCLVEPEDVHEFVKNEFLRSPELQQGGIAYVSTRW